MPVIDVTTAVLFATGSVVIALILCTALRRHKLDEPSIRWLAISNCAFLLAAVGVLLSASLGFVISAMLVIGGAYVGICSAWFAVLATERQAIPWRIITLIGVLAIAGQSWLASLFQDVTQLMLTSSLVNSGLIAFIIWRVWLLIRPHSPRLASLMCMPFLLLLAGYATRIPVVLIWPDGDAAILTTLLIVVAMAWASVVLELAMIALRETQVQERLRAALTKAEAATRARTRFLLGISHDLRTPLNAILGLSELMRNQVLGCLPDSYLEQANHIHAHGKELHELVNDLLLHTDHATDSDGIETATTGTVNGAVQDKFAKTSPTETLRNKRGAIGS